MGSILDDIPMSGEDEQNFDDSEDSTPRIIRALLIAPNTKPELVQIQDSLEKLQEVVGGTITTFTTGVKGTIGIANDEGLMLGLAPNFYSVLLRQPLLGNVLIVGNNPPEFDDINVSEAQDVLDSLLFKGGICHRIEQP